MSLYHKVFLQEMPQKTLFPCISKWCEIILHLSFSCYIATGKKEFKGFPQILSVTTQNDESQNGGNNNTARQIFWKNKHFLLRHTQTYVSVSWGKRRSFFGKFGVPCFFVISVLRFALLLYYWWHSITQFLREARFRRETNNYKFFLRNEKRLSHMNLV